MSDLQETEIDLEFPAEEDAGIFLSISDLMSGLLLFFALLFIVVQVQLQAKVEELRKYQEAFDKLPLIILSAIQNKVGGDSITVDPKTGDVTVKDRILFDEGSAALKPEGKAFLKAFIPVYSQVIFSDQQFDNQIAHVVIEGHTSSKGPSDANRALSLNRALSVTNYIFSNQLNFPTKQRFEAKVLVAGRGEIDANQQVDIPNDRKVVFRFQFRRQDFKNLLEQQQGLENRIKGK